MSLVLRKSSKECKKLRTELGNESAYNGEAIRRLSFLIISLNKDGLTVENTGVQIPEEEIVNIFEAFYRIDKSRNRKTGGTGLGLYIVKTILDQHDNMDYSMSNKENSVIFNINFKDRH